MSTEVLLNEFKECSEHPYRVISAYKQEGKKVIGVLPYFAPVELVVAAGMVPMGIWGSNKKTIAQAKEYCATFYCTIAQLALEMLLDGTLDQLDGIITPTICDTLRPMSQNFRVAMEGKLPCIFLAHPQQRKPAFGLQFTMDQYQHIKAELEKILLSPRPELAGELLRLGLLAHLGGRPDCPGLLALREEPPEPVPRWRAFCRLTGFPIAALPVERALRRGVLHPEAEAVRALALSGGELAALGLEGPAIGAAQRRLAAHILSHPEDNTPARLLALARAELSGP